METGFNCLDVAAKLLIDAVVGLRNDFVGILDKTAADARHPGTHATATLAPAVHAFAVRRNLGEVLVLLGQNDVFRFIC